MTFSKKSFPSREDECLLKGFQLRRLLLLCCAIEPDGLDIPLDTPELLLCVETDPLLFVPFDFEGYNSKKIF